MTSLESRMKRLRARRGESIGALGDVDPDPTDFQFVLRPNKRYWFVTSTQKWNEYSRVLKLAFGDGVRQIQSEEKSGYELASGKSVRAVWVVLEVGELPILVSAEYMGAPSEYKEGDNAYTTGAFTQSEDNNWVFNVVGAWWRPKVQVVTDWADDIAKNVDEFGENAAKNAREFADSVAKAAKDAGKALSTTTMIVIFGVGALVLYHLHQSMSTGRKRLGA